MSKGKYIKGAGGGSSKGSGSSRTPVVDPDSIQSRAILSILDLLGEGQIKGLVNGDQSIFINGTALGNEDGSKNFQGVTWDFRDGRQDQDPIAGFPTVSTPFNVGIQVKQSTPYTLTVSDNDSDFVKVVVTIPALYSQDVSTGDIKGTAVEYQFMISNNNGPFVPVNLAGTTNGLVRIDDKSRSKYQREHSIPLPKPGSNYRIRMTRLTADSTSSYLANDTYIDSYYEILDNRLSYPNSVMCGIRINAEQLAENPSRSYLVDGLYVQVPTNYNPETRTYTGIWDGSFKIGYTNNPAWILRDLLLNKRYGLGEFVSPSQVNSAKLYTIARYCDGMVDDGAGGQEPRFTINTVIAARRDAYKVVQDICSVFRGMSYWAAGAIQVTQDSPTDPQFLFTNANVVGGVFNRMSSARKDRHSVVHVQWNDPLDQYKQKIEYVEDKDLINKIGYRKTDTIAFGCTSRAQAHRVGLWILYTEAFETNVMTFEVGLEGVQCVPGDIVKVHDQYRAGKRVGGRLKASTTVGCTLDSTVQISTGSRISIKMPNGNFEEVAINEVGPQSVITFASPLSTVPKANATWIISEPNLVPELVRCVGVSQSETPGQFVISVVDHNPSKFASIEQGLNLEKLPTTILDPTTSAPELLRIEEFTYLVAPGQLGTKLIASWEGKSVQYFVSWRMNSGSGSSAWVQEIVTKPTFELLNVQAGAIYDFKVVGQSLTGKLSAELVGSYTTLGTMTPPKPPTDLTAVGDFRQIILNWVNSGDVDFDYVEIYENTVDDLSTAYYLDRTPSNTYTRTGIPGLMKYWYWVRTVNKRGMPSDFNSSVGTSAIAGVITKTDLDEELSQPIDDIVNIKETQEQIQQALDTVEQSVADVNTEIGQIHTDIDGIQSDLTTQLTAVNDTISDLQSQITNAVNSTQYNKNLAYTAGQFAYIGNSLYQAKIDVPAKADGTNSPPNATYWRDAGTVIESADGLAARVTASETSITNINNTLSSQASTITGIQTTLNGKADASALTALETRVTAAEGVNTSQGAAITSLNNTVADKADASAVNALTTRVTAAEGQLTTQGSSITTLNNQIGGIGGDNMLTNSSFETLSSPTMASWWVAASPTAGLATSIVDSTLPQSVKALRLDHSAIPVNGYIEVRANDATAASRIKVRGGASYVLSTWARGTAGMVFRSYIRWHDAAGAVLTTPTVAGTLSTTYARFTQVEVAPANAASAYIYVARAINNGTSTAALWVEVDNVQFQEGTVATNYSPSIEQTSDAQATATQALTTRVDQAESTLTSQGTAITNLTNSLANKADASALTALTTRVTTAENTISSQGTAITNLTNTVAGKADASALNALTTRVTTAEGLISSQGSSLTALTSMIGQQPDNLILKGTFEDGSIGPWTADPVISNVTAHPSYSKAITFYANSFCGINRNIITRGGEEFDCSADVWNNYMTAGQTTRLQMQFYDKNLTNLGYFNAFVVSAGTSGFQTYSGRITAPAGAVSARFVIRHETTDGTGRSLWCNIVARRVTSADSANAAATTALTTRVTAAEGSLTSQAGLITNLQANLNSVGGDNLLPNSSFETLAAGSTVLADWWATAATVAGLVNSIVNSDLPQSSKAQRVDHPALPANGYAEIRGVNSVSARIKAKPGPYVLTTWARTTAGAGFRQFISYYNAAGSLITTHSSVNIGTEDFTRYTLAVTAPAGTVSILVYAGRVTNLGTTTGAFWMELDNVQFQEGVVPTSYSPSIEQGLSAAGAATTALSTRVTAAEGAITSQGTSITNLTNSLAGKADTSALNALTTRVSAAEGNITSQGSAITNLQSTVGNIAGNGSNLLEDTYSWLTSTTLPTTVSSSGVTKAGLAVAEADSGYGISLGGMTTSGHFLMLSPTNSTAGRNIRITNGTYLVSMYIIGSAAGSIAASLFGPGGRLSANIPYTTSRTRITLPITVTDITNNEGVPVSLTLYPNRTVVSGLTVTIDSIMVEKRIGENNTPSPFVAGPSSRAVTATAAALTSLTTTVTSQGNSITALSTQVNTLQTDLNNTSASVSTTSTALATLDGKLSASWTAKVQLSSDGTRYFAGMGIGIQQTDQGITQSQIAFQADRIVMINPSNSNAIAPFQVIGGIVYLNSAVIRAATITGAMIADAQITTGKIAQATIVTAHIVDGNITTAKIGDLQVSTLKIAGRAVTIPAAAYTEGTILCQGALNVQNWTAVSGLGVNGSGSEAMLTLTAMVSQNTAAGYWRVRRSDGAILASGQIGYANYTFNTPCVSLSVSIMVAAAGYWAYYLDIAPWSNNVTYQNIYVANRGITYLEVMR